MSKKPKAPPAPPEHRPPADLLVLFCPLCGEVGAAVHVDEHATIEHNGRPLQCPQCSGPSATHFYRHSGELARKAPGEPLPPARLAVVSLIERGDRLLCVWNVRYGGWSLPGGKVEDNETLEQAHARELLEETGLKVLRARRAYDAGHMLAVDPSRASYVHVFDVQHYDGTLTAESPNQPIGWFSRDEFLRWSPFAHFYRRAFAAIPSTRGQP